MTASIVTLDEHRPHTTEVVICDKCFHKWVAVYLTGTDKLECPGCGKFVQMFDQDK